MADTEFGSPAQVDKEASETAAAVAAGVPLEDEGTDQLEEAYEATQREVEQDLQGQQPAEEPAEEPEADTEALLAGKYKTPEDLEQAYLELQRKLGELGPAAAETPELRERLARLEGHMEASQKPEQPVVDPRQETRAAFSAQRQRVYVEQGFDENKAKELADNDAISLGMLVEAEIGARTEKYDVALQLNDRNLQLQAYGTDLREESGSDGTPLRPDWDNVVKTKEFEDQAKSLGDDFYTKRGLELAYLRTQPTIQAQMKEESTAAVEAARDETDASKRRASVGPAATPASKTPTNKTGDDAEIDAIYAANRAGGKSSSVFDGGALE